MNKGDYSGYVGKRVGCYVEEYACFKETGVVTHADNWGGLTIKWDNPNGKIGDTGFLFVNEVSVIGDARIIRGAEEI